MKPLHVARAEGLEIPGEFQIKGISSELLKKCYVVVPAYNEERIVRQVLEEIRAVFPNVVCVDDGSSDGTYRRAAASGSIVLHHCMNVGQGGALETGIQFAYERGGEYFITMDSDGQHRVSDAVEMLRFLVSDRGLDLVLGSRFLQPGTRMSVRKRITLRLGTWISRRLHGLKLTDVHNGLRAFRREAAFKMHFENMGMAHASDLYDVIRRCGFKYEEFPVTVDYTAYSMAKGQSIINAVNILIDFIFNRDGR